MTRLCHYCKEPVEPGDPSVWRAGSVWSRSGRTRSGGTRGGSDRVLIKEHDMFACDGCVRKLKAGRLGQQGLM